MKFRIHGEIEAADLMEAYQMLEDFSNEMQSVVAGHDDKTTVPVAVIVQPVEPELQQQEDDG